jgi:hypothetical protein
MAIDFDKIVNYEQYYRQHIRKPKLLDGQLIGLCRFHEDSNASFGANLTTGQWVCRSGCGEGNVISFHARLHNLSHHEALLELCKLHSVDPDGKKLPDIRTISIETITAFLEIPDAERNYLITRRGWSDEIIKKYKIGFKAKGKRPAYTIPIFDESGLLVNIRTYAPSTQNKIMSWGKGFGSSRLYPISILEESRKQNTPVILCEGEPDVLCGLSLGLHCITQTAGAETWKDPFNASFKDLDVIIAYDNDDSGRQGAARVARYLPHFAKSVSVITWPEWMQDKEDLTDWFMKYKKTAEEFLNLPKTEIQSSQLMPAASDPDAIEQRISEINKDHAVVMVGGRCVVINESIDPSFGGISVTYSSPDDFRNYYRNQKVWIPSGDGKSKQVDIGKLWMESEDRRQYRGITFDPGTTHNNGYYNLFRGFAVDPKKGDWNLFRDHIYNVIADGHRDRFTYLIAWMAHTVQRCGDFRPGVTIVLRGGQGAGKGCFATIFGHLFGSHFAHIWQARQLTGHFNEHLKNAILVFVDEGFWAGDKAAEGALKGMISEKRIPVEPKGKDVFFVRNFMRLIIASNNQWVVPAGFGERRFFVLDVSAKHLQERKYFDAIFSQMQGGGYEAMLHDLMSVDIAGFNLSDFPRTEALFDQIHHTMPAVQKFWFEKLRSYSIHEDYGGFPSYFTTTSLYEEYLDFCKGVGDRHPISNRSFSKEIKRMCPGITRIRRVTDMGRREWSLELPDLKESRSKFQSFVGRAPVDWDDELEGDAMSRDGPLYNDNDNLSHVAH